MPIALDVLEAAGAQAGVRLQKSLNEIRAMPQKSAFLCHSRKDEARAKGLVFLLQKAGWNVYVDWLDEEMPARPDRRTAARIKERISALNFFIFLATPNSTASRWCPWEIGYADGVKSIDEIYLVTTTDRSGQHYGNEYLQLYRELTIGSIEIVKIGDTRHEAIATVGLYIGSNAKSAFDGSWMFEANLPIIPIVDDLKHCSNQLPKEISHLNAIALPTPHDEAAAAAIASAALECVGLLPRQRRIFLSYVRLETRDVALQLYDELSKRQFDVFLDTHDVRPGEVFQEVLWHRLCESDVMVMLDSKNYFARRWTREEFGKANIKKAAILRVAWPGVALSDSFKVTDTHGLTAMDLPLGVLSDEAIDKICDRIELLRSRSIAVRNANLSGTVAAAIGDVKGTVIGVGAFRRIEIRLPRGRTVVAYPAIGVPSAETLNAVADHARSLEAAIVYDHIGVQERWIDHLKWLGKNIPSVRWIQAAEVGWIFSEWDAI